MIVPRLRSRMGGRKRCVKSTTALMLSWIMSSSRSSSRLANSPIEPKPALLMSISISSSRFVVSSKSCAAASGCCRSSARYCARMLVKRPSSLQSAMSLSSERATRKTFLPRAASFLAKAAPMPDDAPVMRVMFIYEDLFLCGPLRNLGVLCVQSSLNAEGAEITQRTAEKINSLQLEQIEFDDVCIARLKSIEAFFCRRIVQVDAGDGSSRAFKDDIFHLLNVNLLRLNRIEHTGEYTWSIEMTDHQSMRSRSLPRQIHHIRYFACFLKLLHDAYGFSRNRFLCLIG